MNKLIKAAIVGCTGYTGIELIKLLNNHRNVEIKELGSRNDFNKKISDIVPKISLNKNIVLKKIEEINVKDLDVVFVCLPHGESQKYISKIIDKVKIIDLSGDFRLKNYKDYKKWYNLDHSLSNRIKEFIYGLPEIYKKEISLPIFPTLKKIDLFKVIKQLLSIK